MPANICETVPASYMKAGLDFDFVDISSNDFQPDKDEIREALKENKKISVLHYNHTYGYVDEKDDREFFAELKRRFPELIIIDDRCLCAPIAAADVKDGFADMYLFSTGKVKFVDIGYGGFAYIKDKYVYNEFDLLYDERAEIEFDKHIKYCHKEHCGMDPSIMTGQWLKNCGVKEGYFTEVNKAYHDICSHKSDLNRIYEQISSGNKLPHGYNVWRYQILVGNQQECIDALFNSGLFASAHYMSLGNGYFSNKKTPNTDWLESHIVNLFNDFRVSKEQVERTVELLNKVAVPIGEGL